MFFTRVATGGIPRGLARTGPAFLSYGFRPFFLGAGVWAVLAVALWVATLTTGWPVGGAYGAVNWHAHEMLFGYTAAALAGFMLTAIPNWTGRLPVSGRPLLGLFLLWLAGRLLLIQPDLVNLEAALIVDGAFLPALAVIAMREIVAGRNWKNLKILIGLGILSAANIWFHLAAYWGLDTTPATRLGITGWVLLIALVGGRIIPSFTRNWLSRRGARRLPAPFDTWDKFAIFYMAIALAAWNLSPQSWPTAALAISAGAVQGIRLYRWHGWPAWREPIVLILHIAYAFLALGLICIGLAALGVLTEPSALHVLTIGTLGGMTLAVMTRASLGHTGRPIKASPFTVMAYGYLTLATLVRPAVDLFPGAYYALFAISGLLWILTFISFVAVYGPILVAPRLNPRPAEG
ncbi:NnrS family protein [Pelagibacterium halotolerans]|uniref:NnrS family protein n=1 Tax=Pelagibacterium halotolerans TaxID=531813 RepID=UPI00384A586E